MNNRGELEIAINKRTLERAAFLLIIVALIAVIFLRGSPDSGGVTAESNLTTELEASKASVASLEHELELTKEELTKAKADAASAKTSAPSSPAPPTAEPRQSLSGVVKFDWNVDGDLQLPADYNAAAIKKLQDEINDLEDDLEDANGSERGPIEDDIEEREDEIDELEVGESRYKLNGVTITIDNQKDEDAAYDYVVCWAGYDCTKTKSSGLINVQSGKKAEEQIKLTIPTILQMNKDQILRLLITKDGKDVFSDQELIKENQPD